MAPRVRVLVRTVRGPARLESGLSIRTFGGVGAGRVRHQLDRAPSDAASRTFLADPVWQDRRYGGIAAACRSITQTGVADRTLRFDHPSLHPRDEKIRHHDFD